MEHSVKARQFADALIWWHNALDDMAPLILSIQTVHVRPTTKVFKIHRDRPAL